MMHNYGDETGKVFIGGLSWDTTTETLRSHFARFGDIIDCVVMRNPDTQKSRGFGFVKFANPNVVEEILLHAPHTVDGRQVDTKACNPKCLNKGSRSTENLRKKVFVGGLPTSVTKEKLAEMFRDYGKVEESVIMYDQNHKSRGFGFLTFEQEESAEMLCSQHFVEVKGKQVECKHAEPKGTKASEAECMADMRAKIVSQMLYGVNAVPDMLHVDTGADNKACTTLSADPMMTTDGVTLVPMYSGDMTQWYTTPHHQPLPLTLAPKTPSDLILAKNDNMDMQSSMTDMNAATAGMTWLAINPPQMKPELSQPAMMAATPNIGLLGQYHQEASSFGPARGYSLCAPSQFMPSIAYAVPPGIIVLNPGMCTVPPATTTVLTPTAGDLGNLGVPTTLPMHRQSQVVYAISPAFNRGLASHGVAPLGFHPYKR